MSRGMVQFLPQYTSGFGLGDRSKCHLCSRHSGQKAEFCGESCTSICLVLFDSIFDRIFDFTFLAFEPYHMVGPSTIQYPLPVFGVSLPIKGLVQSQSQVL